MGACARISVVVVDDHRVLREGLTHVLGRQPGIEVVGQAESGEEAVRVVRETRPDVAVLDVELGPINGIEVARRIARTAPETRTLMLTMHLEGRYVTSALDAGARGYVAKHCSLDELVTAIRAAAEDRYYLSPSLMAGAAGDCARTLARVRSDPKAGDGLTPRELQVLVMTAEGHSVKRIASMIGLSDKTVDAHRRRIIDKLGVDSVVGLVRYAIREGLVSLD